MSQQNAAVPQIEPGQNAAHPLAGLATFVVALQRRKWLVIGCVMLTSTLGGLFYTFADRVYQSSAELLVLKVGGSVLEQGSDSNQSRLNDYIPTYKKVLTSNVVLNKAIESLPTKHRVDFAEVGKEKWTEELRGRLAVSSTRETNVIELSYRSANPETAAVVVDAVVSSYLHFMNDTHKGKLARVIESSNGRERRS